MTFSLTPILVGILFAAPGSLTEITVVTGGRTAPESALEFVFEAENELEPSGLGAVLADTGITWNNGTWIGASAEAWGYTPESEASVFKLGLRAGQGRSLPAGWLAIVAGRYDIEAVPWIEEASSGRAEALAMIR